MYVILTAPQPEAGSSSDLEELIAQEIGSAASAEQVQAIAQAMSAWLRTAPTPTDEH